MKETMKSTVTGKLDELMGIAKYLYDNPEIGLQEYKAAKYLCDYLETNGFEVTREFVLPTGFKAVYHSNKPGLTVALLCEYDALPEIGHGCGHNLIAAIGVGAGLGLKSVIDEIGGQLIILGTPAEENFGGKCDMVDAHVFDDIDFAMMAHPNATTKFSKSSLALKPLKFEFFGQTAHASSQPEKGINALDGAVLTYTNINMLRQYLPSHARVHGVITNGGHAANVIPDYASTEFYFRGKNKAFVEELANKAIKCAEAAALTTGCEMKYSLYEAQYDDLIVNETLLAAYKKNLDILEVPYDNSDDGGMGSTDLGNVSYHVPVIHPYIGIGGNVGGHTRELANQTMTAEGKQALLHAATCLAYTAYDVLTNEKLFEDIYSEFKNKTTQGGVLQ